MAGSSSDVRFQAALASARAGDPLAALAMLEEAHRLDRRHQGIRNALAVLRLESGDSAGAVPLLESLAKELPKVAAIQLNLGNALVASGQAARAVTVLQRASRLDPQNALVWYGLGRAQQTSGDPAAAVSSYERTLRLDPRHQDARSNLAAAHTFLGAYAEAEREAQVALQQQPQDAGARFNLAMAVLSQGRWAEGWAAYEARLHTRMLDRQRRGSPQPRWSGGGRPGDTILLQAEQGFGDTIHFARYVPVLRQRGYRVVLQCSSDLVVLLRTSELCDAVHAFSDETPAHDWHLPLTSLPFALQLHTDAEVIGGTFPYLRAPESEGPSSNELVSASGPRIGLVWAGSPTHVNDMHRSCGFDALRPLWSIPSITWVNLQVGPAGDVETPSGVHLLDVRAHLADFACSAALLRQLDAVVSIDSAMAHLAGALDIPCLVLLPHIGLDWRWAAPANGRLYPSVTPVRQQRSWTDTMHTVRDRITAAFWRA